MANQETSPGLNATVISAAVIYQDKAAQEHIEEHGKLQQKFIRELIKHESSKSKTS